MRMLLLAAICIMCLYIIAEGDVEIRCQQDISVIGKTEGMYSLLFYYSDWRKGNRCGNESMFVLFLSPEGARIYNPFFIRGNWGEKYLKDLGTDSSILVTDSGGRYYLKNNVYFGPPAKDSTFPGSFWKLPRNDAVTWNWEYRSAEGYDLPVIHGAEWNLVYKHNEGVYKNYMIREVYYYPKSSYVVIKTLQPQLDATNKTMDGLMVFFIK